MRVYLDHNATTQVRPDVIELMSELMGSVGNASAVHQHGQAARRHVDKARRQVGKALCARAEDVIFTGGGTEALNLAMASATRAPGVKRVIISDIEHPAIVESAKVSGLPVDILPVTAHGVIDLAWLEQRMASWSEADGRPVLSVMLANNEIGTIQPVAEAIALIKEKDGLVIVDAVQSTGKIPVDFAALGADYMAIAAHKFGGPQGVGALIASCDAPVTRHNHGGGQEQGRRSGTLNVAGNAALGLALEQAHAKLAEFAALAGSRDRMIAAIREANPDVVVLGEGAERLPNTIGLAVPGWRGETQVMAMDLAGISISAGAACSSGKAKASKMGTALGLDEALSEGVIRISLGWSTTEEDVDAAIKAWTEAWARASKQIKETA
ncbi:MAG: cysteine desulfurase family protein [Maricaulis sp.]|uniref:cysteine desulfurase family protein n=1 Tax=Maricaulis sp. TaxID=1486257 RepID=UPI00261FD4DD|nr:cysteine desulfurase family protein [Maricaulis sp.]MDM7983472.1 cysteine desulfurase family protein [Maricaulis sp.]